MYDTMMLVLRCSSAVRKSTTRRKLCITRWQHRTRYNVDFVVAFRSSNFLRKFIPGLQLHAPNTNWRCKFSGEISIVQSRHVPLLLVQRIARS